MLMHAKKLGVLGGMGPKATTLFFEKLVSYTVANSDQDHIDTVILNHASLPDRTEVILQGDPHPFLSAVQKDFELFEQAGVDHIAIPCNTSHHFYEKMQEMTKIPIIHMVDETVKLLFQRNDPNSKVAILATDGTIQTGIYERVCLQYKLQPYLPEEAIQKQIMSIIYRIKQGESVQKIELEEIIQYLVEQENCKAIILGCTELSTLQLQKPLKEIGRASCRERV